jgi:hypothetical protein
MVDKRTDNSYTLGKRSQIRITRHNLSSDRARRASDYTPSPRTSCFLTARIKELTAGDMVGLPVPVSTFHLMCLFAMKDEIAFL